MNSLNNNVLEQDDTTKSIEKPCVTESCSGIYGLRNKTTGKWYVGQSWDMVSRLKTYYRMRCKAQRKLYAAILKYGIDDFEMTVLERTCPSQIMLDRVESEWIKKYNSIENGYNIKSGGSRGKHSKESKEKMSKSKTGKNITPHTEEHKERIRKTLTGRKRSSEDVQRMRIGNVGRIGRKKTQEEKDKIRKSLLGHSVSEESKQKMRDKARTRKILNRNIS
jgi:group I intron endonuclease